MVREAVALTGSATWADRGGTWIGRVVTLYIPGDNSAEASGQDKATTKVHSTMSKQTKLTCE
jgi:hypothetical protein